MLQPEISGAKDQPKSVVTSHVRQQHRVDKPCRAKPPRSHSLRDPRYAEVQERCHAQSRAIKPHRGWSGRERVESERGRRHVKTFLRWPSFIGFAQLRRGASFTKSGAVACVPLNCASWLAEAATETLTEPRGGTNPGRLARSMAVLLCFRVPGNESQPGSCCTVDSEPQKLPFPPSLPPSFQPPPPPPPLPALPSFDSTSARTPSAPPLSPPRTSLG